MRRGLLGKGALLTVTSQAARTSPVTRGKWFLQTFLGVSPPDPPPNVPAIKEKPADTTGNAKAPTMRAARWKRITPIRPARRATGSSSRSGSRSRTSTRSARGARRTRAAPIDATGVLVDGTKVDGVASLRDVAGALFRSVRARRDREAADLRARPRRRVSGHAAGAVDRARRGGRATTGSRRSCWAS